MEDEFEVWASNLSAGRTALHNLNVYVKRSAVAWNHVADQHATLWETWKSFCEDSNDETGMSVATDEKVMRNIDIVVAGIERLDDVTKNTTAELVDKVSAQISEARKDLATFGTMFKTHHQRHKEWDKAAKHAANGKGTKEAEDLARGRYEEASKTIRDVIPKFFDAFELFLQRLNAQILQTQSYLVRKWRNELRHVLKLHADPALSPSGHGHGHGPPGHARSTSGGSRTGLRPSMRSPEADSHDLLGSPSSFSASNPDASVQDIKDTWHAKFLQIMPAMEALSLIGPHGAPGHLSGIDYGAETPSEIEHEVQDREGGGPPPTDEPSTVDKLAAPSQWFGGLLSGEGRIEKFGFHRRHHDDGMFWLPPDLAVREEAIADYDFHGKDEGDLQFAKGDVITILDHGTPDDRNWWRGSVNGREGIFPCNYVHRVNKSNPKAQQSYNDDTDQPDFSEYVPKEASADAGAAAAAATEKDLFVPPAGASPGSGREESPLPPKLPHRPPHVPEPEREPENDADAEAEREKERERAFEAERERVEGLPASEAPPLPHRPHSPLKAPALSVNTDGTESQGPGLQSPIHAGDLKAREDPHLIDESERGPVFQSVPPEEYPETPLPDRSPLAEAFAHESESQSLAPKSPVPQSPVPHSPVPPHSPAPQSPAPHSPLPPSPVPHSPASHPPVPPAPAPHSSVPVSPVPAAAPEPEPEHLARSPRPERLESEQADEPPLPPRSPGHIIEPDFDFNGEEDKPPLPPHPPHHEAEFHNAESSTPDPIERALERDQQPENADDEDDLR